MNKKAIIIKALLDIFLLVCIFIPVLILDEVVDPFKRGFFCNDESLMHPYKPSTISSALAFSVAYLGSGLIIIIIEIILQNKNNIHLVSEKFYPIPVLVLNLYKYLGALIIAGGATEILTVIGKLSTGRLRPHFFAVCLPNMKQINCSAGYIVNYTCLGSNEYNLKNMRLSFPSGHSSHSMFAAVFIIIYMQYRFRISRMAPLRLLLQMVALVLAVYTCLSRISDYKHHWSDVFAGGLLGVSIAIAVPTFILGTYYSSLQDKSQELTSVSTHYSSRDVGNNLQPVSSAIYGTMHRDEES